MIGALSTHLPAEFFLKICKEKEDLTLLRDFNPGLDSIVQCAAETSVLTLHQLTYSFLTAAFYAISQPATISIFYLAMASEFPPESFGQRKAK